MPSDLTITHTNQSHPPLNPQKPKENRFCVKYHAPAARTVSLESEGTMEGDTFRLGNGGQIDGKVVQTVQKSFVQVQNILDQNRLLINEINQNHESKIPDNLGRNVGLIRELNNNIRRVVDLYADLSTSVSKSTDLASSEADSKGGGNKRNRPA
ncbi:hypothetical protein V6N13_095072 [Hibiscus sabdariffa]